MVMCMLTCLLLMIQFMGPLAQTWTGYQSTSTSSISINSSPSIFTTGLVVSATTTATTDSVLLVVNANIVAASVNYQMTLTILRGLTDLSTNFHTMAEIGLTTVTTGTESQAVTLTFMDTPGTVGALTYTLYAQYRAKIGNAGQPTQIGALVIPNSMATGQNTLYSVIDMSGATAVFQSFLSASITPNSATDKVLVSATFSINPSSAGTVVKIALYRGSTRIDTNAMQIISMYSSGSNRQCTIFFLDSPQTASSVTYTFAGFLSNGIGFQICEASRDIAHMNLLSLPAVNTASVFSETGRSLASTDWVADLSVVIIPASTTDQVLVTVNINFYPSTTTTTGYYTIYRNTVNLGDANVGLQTMLIPDVGSYAAATMSFLDSPGVAGVEVTYTIMLKCATTETFVISANGQLRQIAAVVSNGLPPAPPTITPTVAPSPAPINIAQNVVYATTITLPPFFTISFGLTMPDFISNANIWDLRDSVTQLSILALYRVNTQNTRLMYNNTNASGTRSSLNAQSVGANPSVTTVYTISMNPGTIRMQSTIAPALDVSFIYNRISTVGRTYTLYTSNPTDPSSGGKISAFSIISAPSPVPSGAPTSQPSGQPSGRPTSQPVSRPSSQPSGQPSAQPSGQPIARPSSQPSGQPSSRPTTQPSGQPTSRPTAQPSRQPSTQPSRQPTLRPSSQPNGLPSAQPSRQPFSAPSSVPTSQPSTQPSRQPSAQPSSQPTRQPSSTPTNQPSGQPSAQPSGQPVFTPTGQPSGEPSGQPSGQPVSAPTAQPSRQPSGQPSSQPSRRPSSSPSGQPSGKPSAQPSRQPSSQPSGQPIAEPTRQPTSRPSGQPSGQPVGVPSAQPSRQPVTMPSSQPTTQPSTRPSTQPSGQPSNVPTQLPSAQPSSQPSTQPSRQPSSCPTRRPSSQPSGQPSAQPTRKTVSAQPTSQPSRQPSVQPSVQSSGYPTKRPSSVPSAQPSGQPSTRPSNQPSSAPSFQPSSQPVGHPSTTPSAQPSTAPSCQPTGKPSRRPTCQPSRQPSTQPSHRPSSTPTSQPSVAPSRQPTADPSSQPTSQPSDQPSAQPMTRPSSQSSAQPSSVPSAQPSQQPRAAPSGQPTAAPSARPTLAPTGEWATVVSQMSQLTKVSYPDGHVWACGKQSQHTASCALAALASGQVVAQYQFDWDSVLGVLSTSNVARVVLSGRRASNGVTISDVATCNTSQVQIFCDVKSFTDATFLAASFVPLPNVVMYVGWNNKYTGATLLNLRTNTVQSYLYTAFNMKTLTLSQIQSPPAFVGSFVAGTAVRAMASAVNYIVAGMIRTDGGILSGMALMPVSGDILNNAELMNAMALEYTGPDSFIAGGLQLADVVGMHGYMLRANALFFNVQYCVRYRSQSSGRRALSATAGAAAVSQSVVRGMVLVGSTLFMIADHTSNSNVTSLTVLKTSASDGAILKQVHVSAPNTTNLLCTDIASAGSVLSIICLSGNNTSHSRSLLFSVDQDLSFAVLPAGFVRSERETLLAENIPFQRTLMSITKTNAVIGTFDSELVVENQGPTRQPSPVPSQVPSSQPSNAPSGQPSSSPTAAPSVSARPTSQPSTSGPTITYRPTVEPTIAPTRPPTVAPTARPSTRPTTSPSAIPSSTRPSAKPTSISSVAPSLPPVQVPSARPTATPSRRPSTSIGTLAPSTAPMSQTNTASDGRSSNRLPPYVVGASVGGGLGILLFCYVLYRYHQNEEDKKAYKMRMEEYFTQQAIFAEQERAATAKFMQEAEEKEQRHAAHPSQNKTQPGRKRAGKTNERRANADRRRSRGAYASAGLGSHQHSDHHHSDYHSASASVSSVSGSHSSQGRSSTAHSSYNISSLRSGSDASGSEWERSSKLEMFQNSSDSDTRNGSGGSGGSGGKRDYDSGSDYDSGDNNSGSIGHDSDGSLRSDSDIGYDSGSYQSGVYSDSVHSGATMQSGEGSDDQHSGSQFSDFSGSSQEYVRRPSFA